MVRLLARNHFQGILLKHVNYPQKFDGKAYSRNLYLDKSILGLFFWIKNAFLGVYRTLLAWFLYSLCADQHQHLGKFVYSVSSFSVVEADLAHTKPYLAFLWLFVYLLLAQYINLVQCRNTILQSQGNGNNTNTLAFYWFPPIVYGGEPPWSILNLHISRTYSRHNNEVYQVLGVQYNILWILYDSNLYRVFLWKLPIAFCRQVWQYNA